MEFKKVNALIRGFETLELMARKKEPLGISEIAAKLKMHKGTVFSMVHTLEELGVLENSGGKYIFGPKLYTLGKAAEKGSNLIRTVHPYLEKISSETNLSAFLGMRSGLRAIILDKADSGFNFRISSEIGIQIPLVAGAHGKALLSHLADDEVDDLLSGITLRKFTPISCVSKAEFKQMIQQTRVDGIAWDQGEYIEGIKALAIPLKTGKKDPQVAIWVIGVNGLLKDEEMKSCSKLMLEVGEEIRQLFAA
ncbi:HcrR: transcriptional regulator, IclR family, associated with hcr genes [Syntrophobacter sp. SbD1]|nr:HcrR: transcriptional regulator, IclR family, associated with hcr genes [Syntrophobacter sp. SbD1]